MAKRINIITRIIMTVFLALALCVSSFFNVRKAEAIAPAVPAAAAAITALAAELGISEAALMAGVIGITAVGTGVYLLDSGNQTDFISQGEYDRLWTGDLGSGYPENWSDGYQNWRAPNGDTWGDLSPEEQSEYSSPADYVHSGLASLGVLFPDLFQVGNGGDLEPTPEPDPQQDPQGHAKWVKARNVLIAVAAGTGGVALSDAVGMLADNAAGGVKELLFGNGNYGFALSYHKTDVLNGKNIQYALGGAGQATTNRWCSFGIIPAANNALRYAYNDSVTNIEMKPYGTGYQSKNSYPLNVVMVRNGQVENPSTYYGQYVNSYTDSDGIWYLNPNWTGTYTFLDSSNNQIASANLGSYTGLQPSSVNINYGQIQDTPKELGASVINNNNWNTFINDFTDAGNDETRTVTIPNFGDGSTHPQYYDFIDITPDSAVVPVPDDEVNPSPNPNPNPNPNPGTQYEQDFGERVTQLLAQPFNQLFPFCLIGDLQQLLNMLHEAAYGDGEGADINGKSTLTIPLSDFNVEGADEIVFDFSVISSLGMFVRPLITALFVVGLLVGSYRFFLSRGGE